MSDASARKVAVCFPSSDIVHADFALCLANLCMFSQNAGLNITVINAKSSIVAEARNSAVRHAQECGADTLLFLDSDMVFPKAALVQLIGHGKDIVGATYCKRVPPYKLLGVMRSEAASDEGGGLVEMTLLPTGCMLISMAVFERLSRPYFRFETNEEAGNIRGEDYVFCERAARAGYRVWCDVPLTNQMGHVGQKAYRLGQDAAADAPDLSTRSGVAAETATEPVG
ncbi:MAG: hypothetical protein P4L98_10255 [Ancalomicrobiaceae bacterium]|nr:hypothetical protein [Ancalomicrobiaceae bacterium]